MMKKTLILASVIAFTMTSSAFAATTAATEATETKTPAAVETQQQPQMHKPPKRPDFQKKHEEFEKRLKLTDKQKEQAKELRLKGQEQMKPIMEQIKAKHQEADMVRKSRIAPQMQQEKLEKINMELKELRKQAHDVRMQNMKDFEAILTKKQLKEFEKMKQEGRERFEKAHKHHKGHYPAKPGYRPEFPVQGGPGPVVPPTTTQPQTETK